MVTSLVGSPLVDMVSFTGSAEIGYAIAETMFKSGNALKRYVPELGGSAPFIVHEDANLELASKLIIKGCFKNSGQRCTAI